MHTFLTRSTSCDCGIRLVPLIVQNTQRLVPSKASEAGEAGDGLEQHIEDENKPLSLVLYCVLRWLDDQECCRCYGRLARVWDNACHLYNKLGSHWREREMNR